jgi:hypothetical protein
MTNKKLFESLKFIIENKKADSKEPFDTLAKFKTNGGKKEDAVKVCEELRILFSENEILEGKLLEIYDIVVSWCTLSQRIW